MIIGLVGKKSSGKTTITNYLVEKYNFIEYALANPLKKIANIFGFEDEYLYTTEEKKNIIHPILNISSRQFLQKFGTEICRDILPKILPNMNLGETNNIWIMLMEKFIEDRFMEVQFNNSQSNNIIISDIRFDDEAQSLLKYDNILFIYINRNILSNDTHISEQGIDYYEPNIIIDNNGSLQELYQDIDNKLKKLLSIE